MYQPVLEFVEALAGNVLCAPVVAADSRPASFLKEAASNRLPSSHFGPAVNGHQKFPPIRHSRHASA